jgi:hypothetical protein
LEPERKGVAQAFDARAANADGGGVFKKEEGADADAAGALLQEVNQQDDRQRQKSVKSGWIGEMHDERRESKSQEQP